MKQIKVNHTVRDNIVLDICIDIVNQYIVDKIGDKDDSIKPLRKYLKEALEDTEKIEVFDNNVYATIY